MRVQQKFGHMRVQQKFGYMRVQQKMFCKSIAAQMLRREVKAHACSRMKPVLKLRIMSPTKKRSTKTSVASIQSTCNPIHALVTTDQTRNPAVVTSCQHIDLYRAHWLLAQVHPCSHQPQSLMIGIWPKNELSEAMFLIGDRGSCLLREGLNRRARRTCSCWRRLWCSSKSW